MSKRIKVVSTSDSDDDDDDNDDGDDDDTSNCKNFGLQEPGERVSVRCASVGNQPARQLKLLKSLQLLRQNGS